MMKLHESPRPGPSQYICGSGALKDLDDRLQIFKKPLMVTGEKSHSAFLKFYKGNRQFQLVKYDGTASDEDAERIAKLAETGTDVIVGVGGGRVLDTAKGVAENLKIDVIHVPTVVGTCACCSPISAVYNVDHSFKRVGYFTRAAFACIADIDLLIESPKDYFIGGIGDTLAKWYEAVVLVEKANKYNSPLPRFGLEASKITRDVLLRDSKAALESMDKKQPSEAFSNCCDVIFLVACCVGGFGVRYGRMAGAHAVHNGMTLIPETNSILHGVKVAYGILVQLVAEGKIDEVKELIPFYKENKLAYNLACSNITENVEEKVRKIAEFASCEKESFRYVLDDCKPEDVEKAIWEVEKLTK